MDNKIINQIVTSLAADIKVGDTIYFIDRYVNIHRICPTCNGSPSVKTSMKTSMRIAPPWPSGTK